MRGSVRSRSLAFGVAGLMALMTLSGSAVQGAHRTERTSAERGRTPEVSESPTPLPALPASFERPKTNCKKLKCVALTFDDGPGPDTERLLDMLAEADAKATFFIVGPQAAQFPASLLREAEDGHEVGNHTQHHLQLTAEPGGTVHRELEGTSRIIEGILGFRPTLFRPPYGATDKKVEREAGKGDMSVIMWSVDTDDWRHKNSDIVARRAIRGLHEGAIILMHDIHPTTVDAVPRILKAAKRKGLTLATVTDVLTGLGEKPKPGRTYRGR
jgi:peptidoglycan/xylan/chitin deacetylase (PgdA/CDA1 family)